MEFRLFRNTTTEAIAAALRERPLGSEEELDTLNSIRDEDGLPITLDLQPGANKRKKNTLQKGILTISRGGSWQYDGGGLVLAVTCQRRWAPETITSQRYAVVVSVEHSNPEVELYNQIQQQARVYQRVRVQI
jgi:hypothetical protein